VLGLSGRVELVSHLDIIRLGVAILLLPELLIIRRHILRRPYDLSPQVHQRFIQVVDVIAARKAIGSGGDGDGCGASEGLTENIDLRREVAEDL
jgi:hypothetical protein